MEQVVAYFCLGLSLGAMAGIYVSVSRDRFSCMWCGKRHPKRHDGMTAVEYHKFYCNGWKSWAKENSMSRSEIKIQRSV